VGRFAVAKGEAPAYHLHTREDEIFMLIKGTAPVWSDNKEFQLSEGGIVFLPKNVPHGYRIISDTADLLMICAPSGIEGLFRHAGRDLSTPRPDNFHIPAQRLAEAADANGQIILGPPR
jgi:quercetin dioxygenase-like cupin family protein